MGRGQAPKEPPPELSLAGVGSLTSKFRHEVPGAGRGKGRSESKGQNGGRPVRAPGRQVGGSKRVKSARHETRGFRRKGH